MAEPTVRCGLDIGKKNFAVFGINRVGKTSLKRHLARSEVLPFFCQLPPCEIGIESCGGSHYWTRELAKFGHRVRLISAKYVKPYLRKGKNDSNDAEAICEAISRPNMKFVSVKTEAQQSVLMAHRIRSQCIANRVSIINQIHGHLLEFGIAVSKTKNRFRRDVQDVFASAELPALVEELLHGLLISLDHTEERIAVLDRRIEQWAKQDELASKLLRLDGVGPLTASAAVATAGDPSVFKNGRHFAAWLGLVPRQYSTGGKSRLGGITKHGDTYLRMLLIHGARTVLLMAARGKGKHEEWITQLRERKADNVVAVAFAAKQARMIWAVMAGKTEVLAA